MIKIGICDDKIKQIEIMKRALHSYESANSINNLEVSCFSNSFLFLQELENGSKFDILLLDICMPGILGTDIARKIRKNKDKTEIIFITTSDEFAVEAFALKATHYLIKPFSQNKFDEALTMAIERVQLNEDKFILLNCSGGIVASILLKDILYIESYSHEQTLYLCSGEKLETRSTLNSLFVDLNALENNQFISPCKGYIVNQNQIRTITPEGITMKGGKTIPIIKRMFRKTKDAYFEYMFGGK